MLRDDLHDKGYDKEEDYFKKVERAQLEEMRRKRREKEQREGEAKA